MRKVKNTKKHVLMQEAKRQRAEGAGGTGRKCSPVIILSGLGEYTLWE